QHPFRTYERFPDEVMAAFDAATGRGHLRNGPASGTETIAELGEEHLRTGCAILSTSADSVIQVAAHVDVLPLETLHALRTASRASTPWPGSSPARSRDLPARSSAAAGTGAPSPWRPSCPRSSTP